MLVNQVRVDSYPRRLHGVSGSGPTALNSFVFEIRDNETNPTMAQFE